MANLLRTLRSRPDLARNITTFHGSLHPVTQFVSLPPTLKDWDQQWPTMRRERTYTTSIMASIPSMMNLKFLTLHDFEWLGSMSQDIVCDSIPPPVPLAAITLTTLVIECRSFFLTGDLEENSIQLSLILRSQPFLECLALRSGNWDLEPLIVPSDIPLLSHLMAKPREAKVLVRGRPITTLFISGMLIVSDLSVWESIAASSAPITTLTLELAYHDVLGSALALAAIYTKDVQKLVIQGVIPRELPSVCPPVLN
ncbi:hypothetical protein FRB95_008737 [Tulasnella sp. JGI-2019a]|nr:hypothetical protein FRB95_008737 [Tulasnella sp. JGI-2019a]